MGCAGGGLGQNACHCNIEYVMSIPQLDVYILSPSKVYNKKRFHVYVRTYVPRMRHRMMTAARGCLNVPDTVLVHLGGDARDALVSGTTVDNKHDRIS